ncbi:RagB/SusD family nutrient uptake outer membrane protein [Rhodohalobacter sp. SW132]|uniref:RagB/SusD family nutrient uptake outer membrane protein n=1 Tax=Rhodohalobacter sp. SW132 TaxID=2293433 RepID=UPI000E2483DA|nr:RagB/SusD family nutrient uptake outer membrane protein [Rhodohalobacter sp. SW132]REL39083.1 RagB/SusD family nutrient uptake outer membrane protein [Rhodohalobacter sp. SW132]
MKAVSTKLMMSTVLASVFLLAGCGDSFFDRPPQDQIVEGNFYQTEQDLAMATGSLYNTVWFDFNDKAKTEIGDARAGNLITTDGGREQFVIFSTTAANTRLNELWRSLYLVIAHANTHIHNINVNSSDAIPQAVKNHRVAEARFMRGTAYSYLAQLWGDVPIITNTTALIENPNVRRNLREDVLNFAINDLLYAEEHLILDDPAGRVDTWSAKGMLARLYLTRAHFNSQGGSLVQSDLDLAREYAEDVILNSGAELMDNFADLFKRQFNNNSESLFALQWVYGADEWGVQNTFQAYYAPEARLTGVGDGWGGGTSVSAWLYELYGGSDAQDRRRKATFMTRGDHYPELLQNDGGYTYEGTGAPIKKYVIGTPGDNEGRVGFMETDINTYMLRLAEVYLSYAQAVLGNDNSTNNGQAVGYVNAVRERAGLPAIDSISYMDLFEEKWKELAYEGQNWFELVRLYNWQPQMAMNLINDQQRNSNLEYSEGEGEYIIEPPSASITVNESDFRLSYPEAEVSTNPNLMDSPVPYNFDE